MVLYNVTVSIEAEMESEWLDWMKLVHVPEVLKTQKFTRCVLSKIQGMEERETTYSLLYFAPSQTLLTSYLQEDAPALQRKHTERFKDKFVAFRTVLEVIDTLES
ncbi:MAG: DUF4286 family protein [Flavobacteriales bacterium]